MDPTFHAFILAGFAIFLGHLVSCVTGFGANVVALPLLALVVGIEPGKVAIVVLSTLLYGALTFRWWNRVQWKELGIIIAVTGVGLVLGMTFFEVLPPTASKIVLGIFVCLVGLQGLFKPGLLRIVPDWLARVLLFVGGVVHGAFTVGGPLMVIYCHRAIPEKQTFRSTLGAMWLLLNLGLVAGWAIRSDWPPGALKLTLIGIPFTAAGLVLGEIIHHRIQPKQFQMWVNALLIITGTMLALQAVR